MVLDQNKVADPPAGGGVKVSQGLVTIEGKADCEIDRRICAAPAMICLL